MGANYRYSDAVKLRAGLAYDEEAISDQYRTARIPGNDRKWLALRCQLENHHLIQLLM
ncbi:MAG: outer membrane protein transport protein [Methylotenera sp.]